MLKTAKIPLKLHHNNEHQNLLIISEEIKKENIQFSWMDRFRNLSNVNKTHARYWFWDNFDWTTQSLWIGKFNKMNHLPTKNEQINEFLKKLIDDMDRYQNLKSNVYIKLYFSRNTTTREPDINYLLICNMPALPEEFSNTLINVVFERYQLTEKIINTDDNFKNLVNHYINWNNFYTYYDLMGALQY